MELQDAQIDQIYESFSKEHVKLLQNMRNAAGNEPETERQISMLAALLISILKFRNYRRKVAERRD